MQEKIKKSLQETLVVKREILNKKNVFEMLLFIAKVKEIDSVVNTYLVNSSQENRKDDFKKIVLFLSELNELKSHIPDSNPLKKLLNDNYRSIELKSNSIVNENKYFIQSLSRSIKELISTMNTYIDAHIY